ncbi:olfactory receptor 11L1-like [Gastrophryne carolinensis]
MLKYNWTQITEVNLLGFQNSQKVRVFLFIGFFAVYSLTLCGNLLIITLVYYSKTLHTPMYFFLTQLSISDIILTTDISPNLLYNTLQGGETMLLKNCILQLYVFMMAGTTECFLLTVMSYDRYLAICNPLHYFSIMNTFLCLKLAAMSWLLSIFTMMIPTITIASLDFCGPDVINHFLCDILPLLNLSCSDTSLVSAEIIFFSVPSLFIPFMLIIISYSCVIFTILKIPSTMGKQKAFSTCSSHLTVVSIYYVTLICYYDLPSTGESTTISKILSLLYTMETPLLNPVIYTMRNTDIKRTLYKLLTQMLK